MNEPQQRWCSQEQPKLGLSVPKPETTAPIGVVLMVPLFVSQGVLDAQSFVERCPLRGSVLTPMESEDS